MSNADSLRVPKYAKHKATGQARVQINGRTFYLGKYVLPPATKPIGD